MPAKLSPLETPAHTAVLVGDPRRAFVLGQALTRQPRMSHLARGLWGYTGESEGGLALTVQSTGVGGPSAVAVIADLAELGVRRFVRLGTCLATGPGPSPGTAFLIERALAHDGASRALVGERAEILPDPDLTSALEGIAPAAAVASHDLVQRLEARSGPDDPGEGEGAVLRDLQTAAVLAVASKLGLQAAAVLIVVGDRSGSRLDEPELEAEFEAIGRDVICTLESMTNLQLEG